MSLSRKEQRRQLAQQPLTIANLGRYVYLHSPVTDSNRSNFIRFAFLCKYIVICLLIFFCFKFIYGSWLEYYNGEPSSVLAFQSNLDVAMPAVTICSLKQQNTGVGTFGSLDLPNAARVLKARLTRRRDPSYTKCSFEPYYHPEHGQCFTVNCPQERKYPDEPLRPLRRISLEADFPSILTHIANVTGATDQIRSKRDAEEADLPPGVSDQNMKPDILTSESDEETEYDMMKNVTCGQNAIAKELDGNFICTCIDNHFGDPEEFCIPDRPCGENTIRGYYQNTTFCACLDGYEGDPYTECELKESEESCGENAYGRILKDNLLCYCKDGYFGDPYVFCQPFDDDEESTESDETRSKRSADASYNGGGDYLDYLDDSTEDLCSGNPCGENGICKVVGEDKIECKCPEGMTELPNKIGCFPATCGSNNDCSDKQFCRRGRCTDSCDYYTCDTAGQETCRAKNHGATCKCHYEYQSFNNTCISKKCSKSFDCDFDMMCDNGICKDTCRQGDDRNADQCLIIFHNKYNFCPGKGYITGQCDTSAGTQDEPFIEEHCVTHDDCKDDMTCRDNICQNPCQVDPCGTNAVCQVRRHRAFCTCEENHVGDPYFSCERDIGHSVECQDESDCPKSMICSENRCFDPCLKACGVKNTECVVFRKRGVCRCKKGYQGNPLTGCVSAGSKCANDGDCQGHEFCVEGFCDKLCDYSPCMGNNSICTASNHIPECKCPEGFAGDPDKSCFKMSCTKDSECPSPRKCVSFQCQNLCKENTCGERAECEVTRGVALCKCPKGYVGDPYTECIQSFDCTKDSDCQEDDFCDRKTRRCTKLCKEGTCSVDGSVCEKFRPNTQGCFCIPPFFGKGDVECKKLDKCTHESQCSPYEACDDSSGKCFDPCSKTQCPGDQICTYNSTLFNIYPGVVKCQCPDDLVVGPEGTCIKAEAKELTVTCQENRDCPTDMQCMEGTCKDPCKSPTDHCPDTNSNCQVQNHQISCKCFLIKRIVSPGGFCKGDDTPQFKILVHKPGSLLAVDDSLDISLKQGRKLLYSLQQEVLDQTQTAKYSDCDPDINEDEDSALEKCLLDKWLKHFKCKYDRLDFLIQKHGQENGFNEVEDCINSKSSFNDRDYFRFALQTVIEDFRSTVKNGKHKGRCGIKPPCTIRIFRPRLVHRLKEHRPAKVTFLFENLLKVHTYLPPKSFGGFLSDIGGHLGLFLGWSAYTIVEIIQGWISERKKFREEAKSEAAGEELKEQKEPMKEQESVA